MDNSALIGLSRQAALRRQLDVIANNLANVNTAGFKNEQVLFAEYLMPVAEASAFSGDDRGLSYVQDGQPLNDFGAGSQQQTGNPLDVAIDGDAWFVVETPDGERFTRNGAFTINPAGQLSSADGQPVLGDGGPIVFAAGEAGIEIARDGTISSDAGLKGKLRLVNFENPDTVRREGGTLFAGENPLPAEGVTVVQGAIEGSNVRAVVEMTRLIEVTRAYTSIAKILSDSDRMRVDAVDRLGRLH